VGKWPKVEAPWLPGPRSNLTTSGVKARPRQARSESGGQDQQRRGDRASPPWPRPAALRLSPLQFWRGHQQPKTQTTLIPPRSSLMWPQQLVCWWALTLRDPFLMWDWEGGWGG
jgi:hypothetical protein